MKKAIKIVTAVCFCALIGSVSLSAQHDVSAVWARLYQRATTLEQKFQVLQSIVEQHSRDMVPVLQDALDEQIRALRNPRNRTEKDLAATVTKTAVKELGSLKAAEAAPFVWEVVESVDEPFLKGEAIIAIGKMGAKEYAEELALMLRNINFNYDDIENQRENEILAYALVTALERLKVPAGYPPVFFASTGWYSGRGMVKERAADALRTMIDDPTDQLAEILTEEGDYNIKIHALEAALLSKAPEENKAKIASLAFQEGMRYTPRDKKEEYALKNLRITSLNAVSRFPAKDEALLPVMEEMVKRYRKDRIYDEDEMLAVLHTLGSYTTDASARILSDFLAYLTDRREGRPTDSLRIAKAAIIALGQTGSPVGMEELNMVVISSYWENSVRGLAKEALEGLE